MYLVNRKFFVFFFILFFGITTQAQSMNNAMQPVKNSIRDTDEATVSEIDRDANIALELLKSEIHDSNIIIDQAYGYLIFPRVVKVGIGVGVETGEGVLRIDGSNADYYRLSSGSLGVQFGIQTKAIVVAFMTKESLSDFRNNLSWKVGVDGSVTIIDQGMGKSIDTDSIFDSIVAFVFDSRGLMFSLTMEGTVFTLLDKSN